jgi:hypothetical protein
MASSVNRRIEGHLSRDMGQRDPAGLIRPRSTEPIRACGLAPRLQAVHMTAIGLRCRHLKKSLRAGGHPHMSRGDALGGWRPGNHRVRGFGRPDGPFRDEVAEPAREPCRSRRSARTVDRQGPPAATAQDRRAGHGFEHEPHLRRAGRRRLQRAFWLYLLSPAVRIQPARRCGAMRSTLGERAPRRWLARGAGAGDRPLPRHRQAALFSRRRGLRQSRDLRVHRSRGRRLHNPAAGQ